MTGGGGLFACLMCFAVATVIAGPLEGTMPPSWTIGGENLLKNTRGNITLLTLLNASSPFCKQQAYRLELLLQDLHDYGINDLSFLIINSKDSASKDEFIDLQSRVSFPVYQETEEEPVWNVMAGNVNDMFVYMRCGQLMYFIPFPLSDLHNNKESVVRIAVMSAYFRSPRTCFDNEIDTTNDDNELVDENILDTDDDKNQLDADEQQTIYHQNGTGVLQDIEDYLLPLQNDTNSENNEILTDDYDTAYYLDNSSIENFFNYDTNATENDKENSTNIGNTTSIEMSPTNRSLFSSIIHYLWGDGQPNPSPNTNSTDMESISVLTNEIHVNNINNDDNFNLNSITENESLSSTTMTQESETKRPDADACPGIDENICMDWGKQKLKHAQRCCTIVTQGNGNRHGKHCKNLGKKRCKKIQPLLKCCLKTELLPENSSEEVHETM